MKFVLLLVFCLSVCQEHIQEIESFSQFFDDIKNYNPNQLLILTDIDDTLMVPEKKILRNSNAIKRNEFLNKITLYGEHLADKILDERTYIPVENDAPEIFKCLKDDGFWSVAFTQRCAGYWSKYSMMSAEDILHKELGNCGYEFSLPIENEYIEFSADNLPDVDTAKPMFVPRPPLYKRGILLASNKPKGSIFQQFLEYVESKMPLKLRCPENPFIVVMIDDRKSNLISMKMAIEDLNKNGMYLSFKGFLYTGASKLNDQISDDVIQKEIEAYLA